MSKRLLIGILLATNFCAASTQPHLFVGGLIGSSLSSMKPEEVTDACTVLSEILGSTCAPNTNTPSAPIQFEKSDTVKQNFVFSPTVGMTFPLADFVIIEGGVSLDLRKTEYTVTNSVKTNQVMAGINRNIGISGAALIRISKQYSLGPMFSANILRNKSSMYSTGAEEKEYTVYSYGFQSNYEMNDSFSIAVQCLSTLDEQIKIEHPSDPTKNLNLDYIDAKLTIIARFQPI